MSLGIIAKWRGHPLRLGPPIPRAPLLSRQRPAWLPLSHRHLLSIKGNTGTKDHDEPYGALSTETAIVRKTIDPRDRPEVDDLEWAATSRSPFVKPAKNLPNPKETYRSQREHHKSVWNQSRHQRFLEHNKLQPTDWRQIHERLFSATEVQSLDWLDNGMKITLPRSVARAMLQDAGDYTIAAIRRRTKARIAIPIDDPAHTTKPSTEDASAQSTLYVSGSRSAINSVIYEVSRAAGKVTITRLYSPLGPGETEVETHSNVKIAGETLTGAESQAFNNALKQFRLLSTPLTRAEGGHFTKRWIDHHVDLTSLPSTWTIATFENYVAELVDSAVVQHMHTPIYGPQKTDHERAVTERLHQLFNIAPAELVASCSALKIALMYICTMGPKYFPDALKLVRIMEQRACSLDVQVYNILLLAIVRMASPFRFLSMVNRMLKQGYKPDLDTWLLFLRLTQSPPHRLTVVQSIRNKNLLATPEALRRLAKEMAVDDTERALAGKKDLRSFLQEQEGRYGPTWWTRTAGNAIIEVLCNHNRVDDAFKILDLLSATYSSLLSENGYDRHEVRPNAIGFNRIILHARTINKMPLAVNTQRKLAHSNASHNAFDPVALNLLFDIAWKSRLRSSIVVIWRYACLARVTSWRMRDHVAGLLQGKVGDGKFDMSESVHRALGGETLARELAGGREALSQIRKLAEAMVGTENQPRYREKLAILAGRAFPLAFSERVPAVEPGEVLTQSALVDSKCLRARKKGGLGELLSTAQVKTVPLLPYSRMPPRIWVDPGATCGAGISVRTPEGDKPLQISQNISPTDVWDDRWDSQGWALKYAKQSHNTHSMTIIDPRVWADEDTMSLAKANRTGAQIHDEQLILQALQSVERRLTKHEKWRNPNQHRKGKTSRILEDTEDEEVAQLERLAPWDGSDLDMEMMQRFEDMTKTEITSDGPKKAVPA